ncbi:MAG TPA: hypothetical protein VEU74_11935 [Gemmatimonadales bacterium]|nr:hypothetical protein [Gemmatimonadales bacterium]
MTELELVEAAATRARRNLTKPSAEDLVCAYMAERGMPEPRRLTRPSDETRAWFREWARLCDHVIHAAKRDGGQS